MSDFTMTIGGEAVATEGTFGVINPATGEVFAQAPECSRAQLDAAMDSAAKAYRDWRSDESVRRQCLRDISRRCSWRSLEELAPVLTAEQGKPLNDANLEVFGSGHVVHLLRRPRAAPADPPGRRRGHRRGRAPAPRGGGRHHALELPAEPGLLEDRPGPVGRQHHGPEAVALHPAVHPQDGGVAALGPAPRRAERGQRRATSSGPG